MYKSNTKPLEYRINNTNSMENDFENKIKKRRRIYRVNFVRLLKLKKFLKECIILYKNIVED